MIKQLLRKADNALFARSLPPPADEQMSYCSDLMINAYPQFDRFIPPTLAAFLQACNKWLLRRYCYRYAAGCILEPDMGWAMTKKWELLPYSNYNKHVNNFPPPMYLKYLTRSKTVKLGKIIPVNYSWNNYGHFLNDIIGQISLAKELGIADAHIVMPAAVQQMAYFQGFMELSSVFREQNWYFQEPKTFVETEDAYFLNAWWAHKINFDAAVDLIDREVIDRIDTNGNNKIFVGRKNSRRLVNKEEVIRVLDKYGFSYVEVENTSLEAQISLFMNASHVIGIHGAALSSIIFRRGKPLRFMELYPDRFMDPFYYWICVQYGFPYAAMLCRSVDEHGTVFTGAVNEKGTDQHDLLVDVRELEKMIQEFMV